MDGEGDGAGFGELTEAFLQDEIGWIGQVEGGDGGGQFIRIRRGMIDMDYIVAIGYKFIGVGAHGGAVKDELLLMKLYGIGMVISEEKRVLSKVDGADRGDGGMRGEELVREDEGGGGHRWNDQRTGLAYGRRVGAVSWK